MTPEAAVVRTLVDEQGKDTETNPFEIRWAFNAIVRGFSLDGQSCGFSIAPYGRWFEVMTFPTRQEFHTTDELQPRELEIKVPARDAEIYLRRQMSGENPNTTVPDLGLRFGFTGETDAGKMRVISKTLLPDISEIVAFCKANKIESPIGAKCVGQDETDRTPRQQCPTCWLEWLQSDACAEYCEFINREGMTIIELSANGTERERIIKPSIEDMETARDTMIESLNMGLASLHDTWNTIAAELGDGTRKKVQPEQDLIRKDLHRMKPEDRDIANIREIAKVTQVASGGNNDLIAALAQSQMQTNALLSQLVAQNANVAQKPAAAEKPKKEKNSETA